METMLKTGGSRSAVGVSSSLSMSLTVLRGKIEQHTRRPHRVARVGEVEIDRLWAGGSRAKTKSRLRANQAC